MFLARLYSGLIVASLLIVITDHTKIQHNFSLDAVGVFFEDLRNGNDDVGGSNFKAAISFFKRYKFKLVLPNI